MSRKNIKFIVVILAFGIITYLGFQLGSKIQDKNKIAKTIKTIPEFSFLKLDSTLFNNQNLKKDLPTVFIYFNSTCDFCKHEAKDISAKVDKLKDVQIIFVSTELIGEIQQFSENYLLNNISNITFLHDNANHFSTQFGATFIPYVLIYNKEQQLVKAHKGQLNTIGILKALNQND